MRKLVPGKMGRARQKQAQALCQFLIDRIECCRALGAKSCIELRRVAQAFRRLVLPHVVCTAEAGTPRLECLGNSIDTRPRAALRLDQCCHKLLRDATALLTGDELSECEVCEALLHVIGKRPGKGPQLVVGEEQDKVARLHHALQQKMPLLDVLALGALVVKELRVSLHEGIEGCQLCENSRKSATRDDGGRRRCCRCRLPAIDVARWHKGLSPYTADEACHIARQCLVSCRMRRLHTRHTLLSRPRSQRTEEHADRMRHVVPRMVPRHHARVLRGQCQCTHAGFNGAVPTEKVDNRRRR